MRVTYFANDLSDTAVARRAYMLRLGGVDVDILGFRRRATSVDMIDGKKAIDLGQTFDGQLASRALKVLYRSLTANKWRDLILGSDVLLARNLEMVTLADAARTWARSNVPIAYECLDIHGSVLNNGIPSKVLRHWDKRSLRRSATLIVSSQSFLTNYFDQLDMPLPNVVLAENKQVISGRIERPHLSLEPRQPPWKIGWFGKLRCIESFQILMDLAQRQAGLVDIELRGRPTAELQSLIDQWLPLANMRFNGPYAQTDLASIYGNCDFTWAIEYMGQNAKNATWALGNRLYEGGFYNVPTMVLGDTAMGDWLKARDTGVVLRDPRAELGSFIANLTTATYQSLRRAAADVPTHDLVWTVEDCRDFANKIKGKRH